MSQMFKGGFRILSNIWDGALNRYVFARKSYIIDVRQGPKYIFTIRKWSVRIKYDCRYTYKSQTRQIKLSV